MKIIWYSFIFLLLLAVGPLAGAAGVEVSVDTPEVIVGGQFSLTLKTESREQPVLNSQPDIANARWLPGYSSSMQLVNRNVESSVSYHLLATAAGEIVIPPLEVKVGRNSYLTERIVVKAVPAAEVKLPEEADAQGGARSVKDSVFANARFLNDRTVFYVGEEIPLEINVYYRQPLELQLTSYPQIQLDKAVFHDYANLNPEDSRFAPPQQGTASIQGQPFGVYRFRTAFRMIGAGEFRPDITVSSVILIPNQSRSRDPWDSFFGSSYQRYPYDMNVDLPAFTVKPLPAAPAEVTPLGLIGDWKIDYQLSSDTFRVGEPVTLTVTLSGEGSLDNLSAPGLKIPDFRVYPPEILHNTRSNSSISQGTVQYTFIPLKAGSAVLSVNLGAFNIQTGQYQQFPFTRTLNVEPAAPGAAGSSHVSTAIEMPEAPLPAEPAAAPRRSGILYLKQQPGGSVYLPLYRNYLFSYTLIFLLGPVIFGLVAWRRFQQQKLAADQGGQRRMLARQRRGALLRKLRQTPEADLPQFVNAEVVPFLNDYFDLPPGTASGELAAKLQNQELASCLSAAENSSYLPGHSAAAGVDGMRDKLLKALKHFTVWAVLFGALGVQAGTPAEFTDALTAYDRGDYNQAAGYFRQELSRQAPQPNLLYNLGCALCQNGDYAEALLAFEQAKLLAPRDSAIQENLNFVRRKLFLPETGQITNPKELIVYWRDLLRPDQWLMAATVFWSAAFLFLLLRRRIGPGKFYVLLGMLVVLIGLCLTAASFQRSGPYNPDRALTIAAHTRLRSLPSETTGQVEQTLPAGTPLTILESRTDYYRVRTVNNAEGWVNTTDISRIFNPRQLTLPDVKK